MKTRETPSMLKAFKDIYEHLEAINMQPKLHIMDNECSRKIQNYITTNRDTKIQFVKANSHRFNSAERAIQTFKNHFIAGLCTVHKKISTTTMVPTTTTSRDIIKSPESIHIKP